MQPVSEEVGPSAEKGSRVEYAIEGGPEMDRGLHEIETSLRIRLDSGDAFLEDHQPTSDEGGEPVGTFKAPLPAELLSRLRVALRDPTVWSLPPSTKRGFGDSLIRVRMVSNGVQHELEVSSGDIDALKKVERLLEILDHAATETMAHPFQAVRFVVRPQTPARARAQIFAISVKNVGTKTVALPDIKVFGGDIKAHANRDLSLRVAAYPEEVPGQTGDPLVWKRLSFAVGDSPGLTLLAPGQEVVRERIVWIPKSRERHLAQAGFAFYGGPPVFKGALVIKGRALSELIEVTPAK